MYERAESVLNLTMINKYKDKMYLHDVKLSTVLLNSLHAILVNHLTPLDIYINVDPTGCWSCNDAVNEYQTKYYASNILICAENDTLLHVSCGSFSGFVKKQQLKVILIDKMRLEMQINNFIEHMSLLMHTVMQSRPLAEKSGIICDYINMFNDIVIYKKKFSHDINERIEIYKQVTPKYDSFQTELLNNGLNIGVFLKTPKHKKKNYRKRKSKFRYSKNGKLSYKTYRNNKKKKIGRAH
eukprot:545241_1